LWPDLQPDIRQDCTIPRSARYHNLGDRHRNPDDADNLAGDPGRCLGLALWLFRERLAGIIRSLQPLETFAKDDLGFERLNGQLVRSIQGFSTALSHTQTGQLNWTWPAS
jgi:hypothetical protein